MAIQHQCFTPIMFSTERMNTQGGADNDQETLPAREARWHQTLLTDFCELYMKYAATLGFVQVAVDNRNQIADDSILFEEGANVDELRTPTYYMQCRVESNLSGKECPDGFFLLELEGSGFFAGLQLYAMQGATLSKLYCPQRPLSDQERAHLERLHTEHCAQFIDLVHVNSFGYDFNLYNINRLLLDPELSTKDIRLMGILSHTLHVYPKPPTYAHNFVSRYALALPNYKLPDNFGMGSNSIAPSVLAEYMCKRPHAYGLCLVRQAANKRILYRKTTAVKQFNSQLDELVLFCPDMQPDTDHLEFFLLKTESKKRYPKQATEFRQQTEVDAFKIHETWLADMLTDAFTHFQRDQLWARLRGGGSGLSKAGLSEHELDHLLSLIHCSDLESPDPCLARMFRAELEWKEVHRVMMERFGSNARQIRRGTGNVADKSNISLILLHESHPDISVLLSFDNKLHATLLQREDVSSLVKACKNNGDAALQAAKQHMELVVAASNEQVSLVVNALGFFFWTSLMTADL